MYKAYTRYVSRLKPYPRVYQVQLLLRICVKHIGYSGYVSSITANLRLNQVYFYFGYVSNMLATLHMFQVCWLLWESIRYNDYFTTRTEKTWRPSFVRLQRPSFNSYGQTYSLGKRLQGCGTHLGWGIGSFTLPPCVLCLFGQAKIKSQWLLFMYMYMYGKMKYLLKIEGNHF